MIFHTRIIEIKGEKEHLNITQMLIDEVKRAGVIEGFVLVYPLHTTAGLQDFIIKKQEDEPGLVSDIKRFFHETFPESGYYEHDDFDKRTVNMTPNERKNGAAHLMTTFFTQSFEMVAIKDGRLVLGSWQSILLFDFDSKHRKSRNILIQVFGKRG